MCTWPARGVCEACCPQSGTVAHSTLETATRQHHVSHYPSNHHNHHPLPHLSLLLVPLLLAPHFLCCYPEALPQGPALPKKPLTPQWQPQSYQVSGQRPLVTPCGQDFSRERQRIRTRMHQGFAACVSVTWLSGCPSHGACAAKICAGAAFAVLPPRCQHAF